MSLMHARTSERRNTSALSLHGIVPAPYLVGAQEGRSSPELLITHGGARCVDELDQAMLPAFDVEGAAGGGVDPHEVVHMVDAHGNLRTSPRCFFT